MSRFRNRKHFVFFVTDRDVNFLSISVEIFKTFFVCYDSREFVPIFFFCDIFAFFFVRNDPIRRVWEGKDCFWSERGGVGGLRATNRGTRVCSVDGGPMSGVGFGGCALWRHFHSFGLSSCSVRAQFG